MSPSGWNVSQQMSSQIVLHIVTSLGNDVLGSWECRASCLDVPALLSCVNMRQKCVAASPPYDFLAWVVGCMWSAGFGCSSEPLQRFTAPAILTSALQADRKVSCFLAPACVPGPVVVGVKQARSRKKKMWHVFSPPGSPPRALVQPLPPLREGFFHSRCHICLFLSVKVFRLMCIPLHTRHKFTSLSCNPRFHTSRFSFIPLQNHFPWLVDFTQLFTASCFLQTEGFVGSAFCFSVTLGVAPALQLYGEYREQLGNFARREAARLLTERQWRRQAGENTPGTGRRGLGRRHHLHQNPAILESHQSHNSSTKKPQPYSKCQGEQRRRLFQTCSLVIVTSILQFCVSL